MKLRSRINEMFTPEFLDEMFDLFKQHKFYVTGKDGKEERVQDVRHFKALTFRKKLSDYFKDTDVSFSFLGDGTNRMAFLVDGYVFKLALDDQGYIDNLTEFKMSKEAQPYVTKTYETNGLFCVAEYVTLISYDEFVKQKARIIEILDILSSEYLLGDMGWTKKNYCNWGYRKNTKDLVILDYGHMLPMDQNKMICSECGGFLHYNSTFTKIQCISCGKEHDFINIKQKISKREEIEMLDNYLNESVKTTEKSVEIENEVKKPKKKYVEEEDEMVSTRFIDFYPKKHEGRRRLSDFFEDSETDDWDDDDKVEEKDNIFESDDWYNAAEAIMKGRKKVKERKQEEKKYDSIDDYRIAQLVDDENWLFYLGGMVASDEITDKEFFRYKKIIEDIHAQREKIEGEEQLSTIGEVIESKKEKVKEPGKVEKEVVEEDPYMAMLRELGGVEYEEEVVEESKPKQEITEQEAELMDQLMEMDDDIEGGMKPEDFIAQNAEVLGYDEEDEIDPEADKVLARIKRVTNEQLKAMENEMFDDEEDEEDEVPTLEVFEPEEVKNKEEKVVEEPTLEVIEPEVKMDVEVIKTDKSNKNNTIYPENTVKAKYTDKEGNVHVCNDASIECVSKMQHPEEKERKEIEDNIFKVQRKVETVEMKVDGEDVKDEKEETKMKITEFNVYDKALTEEDIAKLFQKVFDEKDPETEKKITELNVYDKPLTEEDIAKLYQKVFDEKDPETEKMGPDVTDTEEIEETFPDQKAIMETIAKAHKQTQELDKDYDHYEDEYGYLYDEEDTMKNKGKNGKGWK